MPAPCDPNIPDDCPDPTKTRAPELDARDWHAHQWACCFEAHYLADRPALIVEVIPDDE